MMQVKNWIIGENPSDDVISSIDKSLIPLVTEKNWFEYREKSNLGTIFGSCGFSRSEFKGQYSWLHEWTLFDVWKK